MQVAVDNTPIATILESSVNISGIVVNPDVDYITSAACWISAGPRCNIAVISEKYSHEVILGNDTISAYSSAMVAALRNFKIDSEEKNAMYNAVDSAWIIYPKGLNLQVGDSLYIKDYSAVYSFLFKESTHCDGPAEIYATGEYFVNPTEDILSTPRSRVLKVEKPKFHNRDAGGRCVNDKKRNVIRY
ncbi:MAG: hypothetical protein J6W54_11455 [Fibrobacter sp.]|uniref:hypothetical protein n=1 Tax=Fibrobacter sp. TaxID=35828 RepID=UPI001B0A2E47|nr:hypothetical protein [Fibrobacter sp.]MBO7061692.1 hypothetical protein [Fibrobacter sp.]